MRNLRANAFAGRSGTELRPMAIHRRRSISLSRHLPVAPFDGSLSSNLNETAVRLWTDPSFDEDGESVAATRSMRSRTARMA
jgi:hypothetical protein